MTSHAPPEPEREPHSDVRRFFAFLVGALVVLGSLVLAFVIFIITALSASPEMSGDEGFGALVVVLTATLICFGLLSLGVSLLIWALRGRWPGRGELLRWTGGVIVVGALAGIAPFFVR